MKNRKRQRDNRRLAKEELLERKNYCGVPDPTPYEAVRRIRDGHSYKGREGKENEE